MATKERVSNTIKNVFWVYLNVAVGTIFPFIIRYMVIRYLGIEYLGMNSVYSSILQVLNVSELGIGQAVVISMYKPVADGKTEDVNKLISLYAEVYFALGSIIGLLGIICIPLLPMMISGDYPQSLNIYIGYLIYLLQSVVGYYAFPHCSMVFTAHQSLDKLYRYQVIIWTIVYVLQIFIIRILHNYYGYIVLLPIATLMCGLAGQYAMKKAYPQYRLRKIHKNDFEKKFWDSFMKRVSAMSISKLRTVFRSSLDTIIISTFIGVVAAAKYQNYIMTVTVPLMLIAAVISGILPSLGNSMAVETKESNLAVIRLITFIVHWGGTVFAAVLICTYQPFMRLWAGEDGMLSDMAMYLFVFYFYLRSISEISILVRNTSGIWWEGKWIAVVETLLNLILNIILVNIWGIEGVILATIISMILINIPFETYTVYKTCFKISPMKDLINYVFQGFLMVIIVVLTYNVADLIHCDGFKEIILKGLVSVIVSNCMLLLIYIKNSKLKALLIILLQGLHLK